MKARDVDAELAGIMLELLNSLVDDTKTHEEAVAVYDRLKTRCEAILRRRRKEPTQRQLNIEGTD